MYMWVCEVWVGVHVHMYTLLRACSCWCCALTLLTGVAHGTEAGGTRKKVERKGEEQEVRTHHTQTLPKTVEVYM